MYKEGDTLRSSYSGEPIEEVKSLVASSPTYENIREKLKEEYGDREPTKEEILQYIKENGLAESILKSMQKPTPIKNEEPYEPKPIEIIQKQPEKSSFKQISDNEIISGYKAPEPQIIAENSVQLRVRIMGGTSFDDYIDEGSVSTLCCAIAFFGQRKVTKSVAASDNPQFNEDFAFEIKSQDPNKKVDFTKLLAKNDPFSIVLIEQNFKTKKKTIIGVTRPEWRHVLHSKSIDITAAINKINAPKKDRLGLIKVFFIHEFL